MLAEAKGEFFFPLDADNMAMPEMIERLVTAMCRNSDWAAAACFRLDFADGADLAQKKFLSAYRPTGGPLTMSCFHNIFGETSGLFRTQCLRSAGGYDDMHPEYVSEDWQLYVKLAGLGYAIGVVPEHLYYYRIRPTSRFRSGNLYINHLQILDQYARIDTLPRGERHGLWTLLVSLQLAADRMRHQLQELTNQLDQSSNQATSLTCRWQEAHAHAQEPLPPGGGAEPVGTAALPSSR